MIAVGKVLIAKNGHGRADADGNRRDGVGEMTRRQLRIDDNGEADVLKHGGLFLSVCRRGE
ncbi:hypothetical protein D3C71_2121570 [compost metagenome]